MFSAVRQRSQWFDEHDPCRLGRDDIVTADVCADGPGDVHRHGSREPAVRGRGLGTAVNVGAVQSVPMPGCCRGVERGSVGPVLADEHVNDGAAVRLWGAGPNRSGGGG